MYLVWWNDGWNLNTETNIQVQEAQRVPNKMNQKITTPRRIIIKMAKVRERILKRKTSSHIKGMPIRLPTDISAETLQDRREWYDTLKVLKRNNLQPRILYPLWLSFRIEGKINNFSHKKKLKIYQY